MFFVDFYVTCECIVYSDLPQVRIAQSQYSILYGGSVYMECTVENAVPPVTSLRWYKGPTQNNFNSSVDVTASRFSGGTRDNPSLNITNALPLDEGYYACNATNLVGSAFASTFLDVYGGMFMVFFLISKKIKFAFYVLKIYEYLVGSKLRKL